jgi:hypothetical protein
VVKTITVNLLKRDIMERIIKLEIDNKKYKNIDYGQFIELINNVISKDCYNIVLQLNNTKWLQVFRENGSISMCYELENKIYQFYKLEEKTDIQNILQHYFIEGNVVLHKKADEIVQKKQQKNIMFFIGLGIVLVSVFMMFICNEIKTNDKIFNVSTMFAGIGLMVLTYNGLKNKEYNSRNDLGFFGGISIVLLSLYMLIFK